MTEPIQVAGAASIRAALAQKKRRGELRRTGRAGRGQISRRAENVYAVELLRIVGEMGRMVEERIIPRLAGIAERRPRAAQHHRADAGGLQRLVGRVETAFARRKDIVRAAASAGRRVAHENSQLLRGGFQRALGVDPIGAEPFVAPMVEQFVSENVRQVGKLADQFFTRVEARISQGLGTGRTPEEIAADLRRNFVKVGTGIESAKKRARQLARDQVNRFSGELQRARQTKLGVKRYVWRTSRDERVRPLHRSREGKIFRWSDPPDEDEYDGHPGIPPNCRCHAEPYLEDLIPED